jgi:hypothetical protein
MTTPLPPRERRLNLARLFKANGIKFRQWALHIANFTLPIVLQVAFPNASSARQLAMRNAQWAMKSEP